MGESLLIVMPYFLIASRRSLLLVRKGVHGLMIDWIPHTVKTLKVLYWPHTPLIGESLRPQLPPRDIRTESLPPSEGWCLWIVGLSPPSTTVIPILLMVTCSGGSSTFLRMEGFFNREILITCSPRTLLNHRQTFLFNILVIDINDILIKELKEGFLLCRWLYLIEDFENDEKTMLTLQHPLHDIVPL
jgi:hypothetical protein